MEMGTRRSVSKPTPVLFVYKRRISWGSRGHVDAGWGRWSLYSICFVSGVRGKRRTGGDSRVQTLIRFTSTTALRALARRSFVDIDIARASQRVRQSKIPPSPFLCLFLTKGR